MLKHSIMTVPYNVTAIGIADKLAALFERSFILIEKAKKLETDKIITLSTCSDAAGTGRIVLHAKLIKSGKQKGKVERVEPDTSDINRHVDIPAPAPENVNSFSQRLKRKHAPTHVSPYTTTHSPTSHSPTQHE